MDYNLFQQLSDAFLAPITVFQCSSEPFLYPKNTARPYLDLVYSYIEKERNVPDSISILWAAPSTCYGIYRASDVLLLLGPADGSSQQEVWRLQNALALVNCLMTGQTTEPGSIPLLSLPNVFEIPTQETAEHYALYQSEENRDHASASYERELLRIVREGDVEAMRKLLTQPGALGDEHMGIVAKEPTKRTEYYCVALLTLMPRAAIEGGLNVETAHSMADLYLQQLEQCRSVREMFPLTARAQMDFTHRVRQARETASRLSYIEDCKNYIAKHLRKPFKIGEIAPAIGVNRTYLAHQFVQAEGITIQQYVRKERCTHAAELLKYSDYPIALISEYFCFSSQSHFGRAFKEIYQMTPKEYRNRFQRKESTG